MIPTSTDVRVEAAAKFAGGVEMVAIFADAEHRVLGDLGLLPDELRVAAESMLEDGTARGKAGEIGSAMVDVGKNRHRLVVVGVGKGETLDAQAVRVAAARVTKQAKHFHPKQVAILPPTGDGLAEAAALGFLLAAFDYREYRGTAGKSKEERSLGKTKLTVLTGEKEAVARAEAIAFGQNYARTIASRPGNDINPASLAKEAQKLAKELGLGVRVIDAKEADRLGMGGLLAVGRGSATAPCMIVLEYTPGGRGGGRPKKRGGAPLLAVGKSITFDTGGISIKPAANMGSMIFDKCGGMTVLGLMASVAKLKPATPVVGILAAAENMPGPSAYRPGDILRMYNGVTVEVTNTDAEGRLVLADALAWGIETFKPSACVNLATLTGACVVALGQDRAGAWCNDENLWNSLNAASTSAGEKLWRMPLGDDYREMLKATSADIVNAPGRWGGACTAAEFLHYFIPGNIGDEQETPWCHLDIAGVADTEKETPLYGKGATGFGVRTLVEWVTSG